MVLRLGKIIVSAILFHFSIMPTFVPVEPDGQSIRAVPTIVGTKYCAGDADLFSASLKLQVRYVNQTKENLILDKEIGKAWFQVKVAKNLQDLNAGKYEYSPNTDWFFSDKDQFPPFPKLDSPGPDFAILGPGKEFEGEINSSVFVQYESSKNVAGSIRPGSHFMQIELSGWNHPGKPSEFAKSWQRLGSWLLELSRLNLWRYGYHRIPRLKQNASERRYARILSS